MKIAVAQTRPKKGDISANIDQHVQLIRCAIEAKAEAIFFPELSITGYEPTLAKALAMHAFDQRLEVFNELSARHNVVIGVGIPKQTDLGVEICMVVFKPDTKRQTYSKQFLHTDEFPYFVAGETQLYLGLCNSVIAPAICYESLIDEHVNQLTKTPDIYVASVSKPQNGIEKAAIHYPTIARQNKMYVVMANNIGASDTFMAVGNSGVWDQHGELLDSLDSSETGILVLDTSNNTVYSKTLEA
ncbi:MAG: carbon-nitrogen hydrolase family protein [Bacteroidia bacterium]|nr:carbon-nitrogen hydrolase family protein [Bacteroidia bacterium]